jgi:acetyltransferase-like isoleucine patch superfamily enzyme
VASELGRGHYYRLKFRLLRRRVLIGKRFRVTGKLDIQGPGTVIFGNECVVLGSRRAPVTPYTHAPDAVISFGDRVMLSSTRLGCQVRIEVGEGADLADARIMDTDFHAVNVRGQSRRGLGGAAKPVRIGPYAWIGAGAMVLKGVRIGANAIVGAGAVVMQNVPADAVVVGNPARVVWRLRPVADGS